MNPWLIALIVVSILIALGMIIDKSYWFGYYESKAALAASKEKNNKLAKINDELYSSRREFDNELQKSYTKNLEEINIKYNKDLDALAKEVAELRVENRILRQSKTGLMPVSKAKK